MIPNLVSVIESCSFRKIAEWTGCCACIGIGFMSVDDVEKKLRKQKTNTDIVQSNLKTLAKCAD